MNILIWITLILLFLKVFWNLTLPFRLLGELRRNPNKKTKGISVSPEVEFALLIISIVISALSNGDSWINSSKLIGIYGGGAIVFSYVNFYLVGSIGTRLMARSNKK